MKIYNSKTNRFLEYYILYSGMLNTIFITINTLTLNYNSNSADNVTCFSYTYRDGNDILCIKDAFNF